MEKGVQTGMKKQLQVLMKREKFNKITELPPEPENQIEE